MDDGTALEKLLKDLGFLEVLNIDRRMGAEHYRFVIPGYPLISYFVEHYKEQYRFTYYYNNTASKSRFLRNIYTKDESVVEEFLIDLMENPLDTPIGNLFMELCDKTNGIFESIEIEQFYSGSYGDHEACLGNNLIKFFVFGRNFLVRLGESESLILYEEKDKIYETTNYKDMSLYITKLSIIYEG